MAAPGFYEDRAAAQALIDRRQGLMWQVGDLMHQWEELQALSDRTATAGRITILLVRLHFCYTAFPRPSDLSN
jgi:hypothetical protein